MKQEIATTTLPTLEEAKELTSFINRPLNNQVVLLNCVAPKVSKSGLAVGKSFQEEAQKEINKTGMMIVHAPKIENVKVEEGELTLLRPECPSTFSKVIKSKKIYKDLNLEEGTVPSEDMYQRYVVLVVSIFDLTLILDKKLD